MQPSWPTADAVLDETLAEWAWCSDLNLVTRRADRTAASIDCLLATEATAPVAARLLRASGGALRIEVPFSPSDALVPTWRATGRLYGSGPRLARFARVEIELSDYDASTYELQVRARCRHVWRWGRRRQRRYFDAAHRAADSIVAALAFPSATADS